MMFYNHESNIDFQILSKSVPCNENESYGEPEETQICIAKKNTDGFSSNSSMSHKEKQIMSNKTHSNIETSLQ